MRRPASDSRELERQFFDALAARKAIRVFVRSIVVLDDHILLQRMPHEVAYWYFPGGELELGESMEEALYRELAEETTLRVDRIVYRFTANNRFEHEGRPFHTVEHFFEVTPAGFEVESLEQHTLVGWHPLATLRELEIRPWGVRDILALDGWRTMRLPEVN